MSKKPNIAGNEVAGRSKRARFERGRKASATMSGKNTHFTPARLDHLERIEDLEEGQVIGVLETDLAGDETDLPPGKFNLFVRKGEDGEWEGVAESEGRIVSKAARVTVRQQKAHPGRGVGGADDLPRPDFREHGWCWCGWAPIGPFFVYICICW